jgi:peroxiredoxin
MALPTAADDPAPTVQKPAPAFTLTDVDEKKRSLAEFRGRRVALFFFCGCSWCADIGKEWAQLQRSDALPKPGSSEKSPITLVVNSGLNAAVTRTLAANYELDLTQTVLLPDPEMQVTKSVYRVDPCPRAFIIDGKGILRYTNNSEEDAPRKVPALAIVSRALDALRASEPAKSGPEKAPPR